MRSFKIASAVLVSSALVLTGCGGEQKKADATTVTVLTHDSWAIDPALQKKFESESGLKLKVLKQGDTGTLVNKMVLTKDSPLADAVYGIDNTFATRAYDAGVLADLGDAAPSGMERFEIGGDADKALAPIDYSDVCVNVDNAWFAKEKKSPPKSLDDLTKPEFKGLFATPGATTSSPGLAFLLTTIAAKGDGWESWWKSLLANDVAVTSGWSEAYEGEFTAGGGKGKRPIVVSYSSSPPFTVPEGGDKPTTSALLDTCFRQVEYAGVIKGGGNEEGAKKFVEFLGSTEFQESLPETMYVYPTSSEAKLPAEWAKFAPTAEKPWTVPSDEITKNRADWLRTWRDIASR